MDVSQEKKDFFAPAVVFQCEAVSTVEAKHPSQKDRYWALQSIAGLVAGAVLMMSGQASATEPRIVPLETAALEFHEHCDARRVESQGLSLLFGEGYALADKIRSGELVGSAGLRAEISRLSMIADLPSEGHEDGDLGAFRFIAGLT